MNKKFKKNVVALALIFGIFTFQVSVTQAFWPFNFDHTKPGIMRIMFGSNTPDAIQDISPCSQTSTGENIPCTTNVPPVSLPPVKNPCVTGSTTCTPGAIGANGVGGTVPPMHQTCLPFHVYNFMTGELCKKPDGTNTHVITVPQSGTIHFQSN